MSLVGSRAYTKSKHTDSYTMTTKKKIIDIHCEQEPIRVADSKLSSRYLNYFNLLYIHTATKWYWFVLCVCVCCFYFSFSFQLSHLFSSESEFSFSSQQHIGWYIKTRATIRRSVGRFIEPIWRFINSYDVSDALDFCFCFFGFVKKKMSSFQRWQQQKKN